MLPEEQESLPSQNSHPEETSDAVTGFMVVIWNKAQTRVIDHEKVQWNLKYLLNNYLNSL